MTLKERYLGFSEQDLLDRLGALESEIQDLDEQIMAAHIETIRIKELLEE